jgi:hypothetical protein
MRPYYGSVQVCFDCKNRQIGCHQDCEVYKDAKKKSEEEKQRVREEKRKEFLIIGNKSKRNEAVRRWYRKYGV